MDKDFVKNGIIIPAIIALVVGITGLLLINSNVVNISPFTNGEQILYFENLSPEDKITDEKNPENFKGGEVIGKINSAAVMNLRYKADYSSLAKDASLDEHGVFPGETGTAYIRITNNNKDKIGSTLSVSGLYASEYKKTEEKTLSNEEAVFRVAPRARSSVVVFYQTRGSDFGLSSKYKAIIYEEVK